MEDMNMGAFVWLNLALFLAPTIGVLIWAGIHHWDPDEIEATGIA